jgi:hypothetical protein
MDGQLSGILLSDLAEADVLEQVLGRADLRYRGTSPIRKRPAPLGTP